MIDADGNSIDLGVRPHEIGRTFPCGGAADEATTDGDLRQQRQPPHRCGLESTDDFSVDADLGQLFANLPLSLPDFLIAVFDDGDHPALWAFRKPQLADIVLECVPETDT